MPIPKSRVELVDQLTTAFDKLKIDLDAAGSRIGKAICVDNWTVKDVLAVRVWWTTSVIDWVEAGKRGEIPETPAPGYGWNQTPKLNQEIVAASQTKSFKAIKLQLEQAYERVLNAIDQLDDRELLEVGVFPWAEKYPISRWLSINTTRQYTTARTYVRKSIRDKK